jgi:pimeloyl-ACP methyl ester carboxylesterase
LIMNGEADVVIPPINSVILSQQIKHSRLMRWKDGGHAMIYQYPKEMAEDINQFI